MERLFQKKLPFETHSRKNLPYAVILKNFKVFFRNNLSILPKNPNFERFENLLLQSHSAANLLQFGEKIISDVNKNADVNAIGKHRVKKKHQ